MDWDKYSEVFPTRYTNRQNYLNDFLKGRIRDNENVLEIGGGKYGTKALEESGAKVYYLDSYISEVPKWTHCRVCWTDVTLSLRGKFNTIVANNSINYLSVEQLKLIPAMLAPRGAFIANTFVTPTIGGVTRDAKNALGQEVIEEISYRDKMINHKLITPDDIIEHSFFHYTKDEYFEYLDGCYMDEYNVNSMLIRKIQGRKYFRSENETCGR